jgi:hypothetical protein
MAYVGLIYHNIAGLPASTGKLGKTTIHTKNPQDFPPTFETPTPPVSI